MYVRTYIQANTEIFSSFINVSKTQDAIYMPFISERAGESPHPPTILHFVRIWNRSSPFSPMCIGTGGDLHVVNYYSAAVIFDTILVYELRTICFVCIAY